MKQQLKLTELSRVELVDTKGGANGGTSCTCGSMEEAYGTFSFHNCECCSIFNSIGLDTGVPID
jgi:hypothetical protein